MNEEFTEAGRKRPGEHEDPTDLQLKQMNNRGDFSPDSYSSSKSMDSPDSYSSSRSMESFDCDNLFGSSNSRGSYNSSWSRSSNRDRL